MIVKFFSINDERALCSVTGDVDATTAAYACVDTYGVREVRQPFTTTKPMLTDADLAEVAAEAQRRGMDYR